MTRFVVLLDCSSVLRRGLASFHAAGSRIDTRLAWATALCACPVISLVGGGRNFGHARLGSLGSIRDAGGVLLCEALRRHHCWTLLPLLPVATTNQSLPFERWFGFEKFRPEPDGRVWAPARPETKSDSRRARWCTNGNPPSASSNTIDSCPIVRRERYSPINHPSSLLARHTALLTQ